jgi:DNA anti-recombination protein RmuC
MLARFRSAFTEDSQATLTRASQELLNQMSSVLENVRAETLERENKLREAIAQMDDQAVQAHELRLDQISRLSLQEAMSKFNQESTEHLDRLVRTAEQGLRHTCNEVFTEVGESLRQRLLELTFVRPAAKAATDSA